MFCPNCGKQIPEGSATCPQCGEFLSRTRIEGGAFKGFLIMLISFFTMPLKTLKITLHQLRELGGKGSLEVEDTEIPHLTWLGIAGHFVASFVIILLVIGSVMVGLFSLFSLKALDYSVKTAIGGLVISPIIGVLLAIAANWLLMVWLELLLLMVNIANNINKIAGKN